LFLLKKDAFVLIVSPRRQRCLVVLLDFGTNGYFVVNSNIRN